MTVPGERNDDGSNTDLDLDMSNVAVLDSVELPPKPSRSPSRLSGTKASALAEDRRRGKEARHIIAKEYQLRHQGSNLSQIRRQGSNSSQLRRQDSSLSQIRRQGSNTSATKGRCAETSQAAGAPFGVTRTNSSLARAKKYSKRHQAQ